MQIDITNVECYVAIVTHDGKNSVEYTAGLVQAAQSGLKFDMGYLKGNSIVQVARNLAVHSFMTESKAQKLIFIDTDIGFTGADLLALVAHSTRYPVVAGIYCTKDDPPRFVARPYEMGTNRMMMRDRFGLIKMTSMPLGFSVIDRKVFEAMSDFPTFESKGQTVREYFRVYVHEGTLYGEDIDFCIQAQEKGFELWSDPSIKLDHFGDKPHQGDFMTALKNEGFTY